MVNTSIRSVNEAERTTLNEYKRQTERLIRTP
jgi:hypothetical protein